MKFLKFARAERERESSCKIIQRLLNHITIKRIIASFFVILLFATLISGLKIKNRYFHHKLPTKSIKLEDIKSVQIINLDRAKDRREHYEKMLHDNFGDTFMGHKIGEEIRLSGVDGKKEIIFENLGTGKKLTYDDFKVNGEVQTEKFDIFKSGVYKVYSKNNPKNYTFYYFNKLLSNMGYFLSRIYNKFGIKLSILKALHKIAKQPNGTYGAIFEDDFLVEKDFYDKLSTILQNVPEDFDALKLSINPYDIMAGLKKVPLRMENLRIIKRSFRIKGYGDWIHAKHIGTKLDEITWGNQFFIVSKKGAEKIIRYYYENIAILHGTDIELWHLIPKIDPKINTYIYLKEVPVLLNLNDSNTSSTADIKYDEETNK